MDFFTQVRNTTKHAVCNQYEEQKQEWQNHPFDEPQPGPWHRKETLRRGHIWLTQGYIQARVFLHRIWCKPKNSTIELVSVKGPGGLTRRQFEYVHEVVLNTQDHFPTCIVHYKRENTHSWYDLFEFGEVVHQHMVMISCDDST